MPAGRPTKYTPELLEAAHAYVDGGWQEAGDAVPTLVGLAITLDLSDETVHAWAKDPDKKEFSGIFMRVKQLQHQKLINGGLGNEFNPAITKMMLTKHGYSDKQEVSSTVTADVNVSAGDQIKDMLAALSGAKQGGREDR